MDKRTEFRAMNDRKLETYADMAGMTIYRDKNNRITHLSYKDYSFGDPDDGWREREELFGTDPDEERLSDKTCDRYFIDYWKVMGGPYRHNGSHYKTQEDLENEIKWLETRAGRLAEADRLKKEAAEAERMEKRRLEERRRRQKAQEATKRRVARKEEHARIKAAEWKRQHPNYGPPTPPPAPSRRETDPFAFDRQWPVSARERFVPPRPTPTEQKVIERQYQETEARRMRQKEAMDTGTGFSTPQQPGSAGVITWSDPLITDVRLVRLVLGADRGSREMTVEEQADYWYWKARGK
jgi:hypothetical protein